MADVQQRNQSTALLDKNGKHVRSQAKKSRTLERVKGETDRGLAERQTQINQADKSAKTKQCSKNNNEKKKCGPDDLLI